jgi:subtilisin family serine protease
VQECGLQFAGQGVIVGLIDIGIDPTHSSFVDDLSTDSYPVPAHYSGICEVTNDFPSVSCNRKLVGVHHFVAYAITRGVFNASQDLSSPSDTDGHGLL